MSKMSYPWTCEFYKSASSYYKNVVFTRGDSEVLVGRLVKTLGPDGCSGRDRWAPSSTWTFDRMVGDGLVILALDDEIEMTVRLLLAENVIG